MFHNYETPRNKSNRNGKTSTEISINTLTKQFYL